MLYQLYTCRLEVRRMKMTKETLGKRKVQTLKGLGVDQSNLSGKQKFNLIRHLRRGNRIKVFPNGEFCIFQTWRCKNKHR